jgi:hypothetical protein
MKNLINGILEFLGGLVMLPIILLVFTSIVVWDLLPLPERWRRKTGGLYG